MPNYPVRFVFLRNTNIAAVGIHCHWWTCKSHVWFHGRKTLVCLWFGTFCNGRTGFEGKQRPGCYSELQRACLANAAATEDRRIQVTDFARLLDISLCAAHSRCNVHGLQKSLNAGCASQMITKHR